MRAQNLALAFLIAACSRGAGTGTPAGGGASGRGGSGDPSVGGASGAGAAASSGASGSAASGDGGTSAGGSGLLGGGGLAGDPGGHGGATGGNDAGAGGGSEAGGGPLRIFWVDTEGGAATVMGMPTGEVLVVDAGFSSAHAQRVADVIKGELHATRIDVMIVSHYHIDHVGGVPSLAGLVPIGQYFDHGAAVETGGHIDAYMALFSQASPPKRTTAKPGSKLTFGPVELTFVTSAGAVVDPPLPTAVPNTGCDGATRKTALAGAENPMSVGFVARYGQFDFLDTADLTWNAEQALVCPTNRVGIVDLYQVNHHGMDLSSSPQLVYSIAPLVAVMNNGAAKGGSPATFELLEASPGLQALWALHHVTANDAAHNAEDALTANLGGTDQAYWLSATIEATGAFTITNGRTRMSRSYQAR